MAELCVTHDVNLCSDEVWGELPLDETVPFVSTLSLLPTSDQPGGCSTIRSPMSRRSRYFQPTAKQVSAVRFEARCLDALVTSCRRPARWVQYTSKPHTPTRASRVGAVGVGAVDFELAPFHPHWHPSTPTGTRPHPPDAPAAISSKHRGLNARIPPYLAFLSSIRMNPPQHLAFLSSTRTLPRSPPSYANPSHRTSPSYQVYDPL